MAFIIWLLGLLDVYLTRYGLAVGAITEGNPVMASLFEFNPDAAVAFSLIVSAFFLACLHYLQRHSRLAQKALWGILFLRIAVIALHVHWFVLFHIG